MVGIHKGKENDYFEKPKESTIYTPAFVADRICDILTQNGTMRCERILDPCIGAGALVAPFVARGLVDVVVGIDVVPSMFPCEFTLGKYELLDRQSIKNLGEPDLVIMNPPFNGAEGRQLYPEIFLRHTETLGLSHIPVCMIAPMGMRLNQRMKSDRWRYLRDRWNLTGVMALPIDVWPNGVLTHSEVLFFNACSGHFFLDL